VGFSGLAGCVGGLGGGGGGEYPSNPIEVIVPYSAGGGSDTYARQFAEQLTDILGVEFQVSNITGAGAMNGQREMTTADPDGYTLSVGRETWETYLE
jgi:tripartite-type tricarboxylate transporter receptor subunit TctC